MTNLEKMNELVESNADKDQIVRWAYMNRIYVCELAYEDEFVSMENYVNRFIDVNDYFSVDDERDSWRVFLDAEYVA